MPGSQTKNPEIRALISLHDVMPETLSRVRVMLDRLREYGIPPIALLVVPGRPWTAGQIDQLKAWSAQGYLLAAHGWIHEVKRIRGPYHWLHSRLISRNVAEHLGWDPADILPNILRSVAWFPENNLPVPDFYVPPAWALGNIRFPQPPTLVPRPPSPVPRPSSLVPSPSSLVPRHIETLSGIIDTRTGRTRRLPLVGFEADTWFRERFVRTWNRVQMRRAGRSGRPLRVSLHPYDLELRLSGDLGKFFQSPNLTPLDFDSWLADQ